MPNQEPNYFAKLFSGEYPQFSNEIPTCYLVVDTETSGLDPFKNGIVQLAYALVENRQFTEGTSFLLKPFEDQEFHEEATKITGITKDACVKDGIDRDTAFNTFFGLWNDCVSSCGIAGHNIYGFDYERLGVEANRRKLSASLNPDTIWDTGMLVKASLLRGGLGSFPTKYETRLDFYKRISNTRAKILWNLKHCTSIFDLKINSDSETFHDALFDCKVCGILLEKLFDLAFNDKFNTDYLLKT